MEDKAVALMTNALNSTGLVSEAKVNTLATHLSKGAKNWCIKQMKPGDVNENQKEIQKYNSKLWTEYLAKRNYIFDTTENGIVKRRTPLVIKQERLLEIKNQMPDAILYSEGSPLPVFGKIPTELSWPLSNNHEPTPLRIGIANTLEYYESGNVNPQNSDDVL